MDRVRSRGTFTLDGVEHRGTKDGNRRLVFYVRSESGLLVLWGTMGRDTRHIDEAERALRDKSTLTIECDWIAPDDYEARNFKHAYWVTESDHFRIVT